MQFTSGDVTAFVEPSATSSEFDIDFTLDAPPESNVFAYQIDGADDLDFFYQPPLTRRRTKAKRAPRRSVRMRRAKTKRDHIEGETNYGTGKLFHIYRPKATDANGSSTWAELSYADGVLSVTVPQDFLNNATYPLTVDPTFGYTSAGASLTTTAANTVKGSVYLSSSAGAIDSISFYTKRFSSSFHPSAKGVLFSSTGTIIANGISPGVSEDDDTLQWRTTTFSPTPIVSASTNYALGHITNDFGSFANDTAASTGFSAGNNYTTPTDFSVSLDSNKYSIYATYTADGSSAPDDGVVLFE